ncbi:uncharacterized protein LOC143143579 [Ptiloglossa arizonensis]|uniref:uncharacterized protein LOC143143579 n=1 Tax=Ptiloglossa arizonensis TaxID=3350558 RepID=UPI003F9EEF63
MARKRRKVPRKILKRKLRNVKPMKIAALIVSAIQDLRETKGSAPNKIIGYISYASNMAENRVKRQVKSALKKGVEYGILTRYRGLYFLPTGDELKRANRIALRFAKLPIASKSIKKSNTVPSRRITPLGSRKNSPRFGAKSQKTKRLLKARKNLISPTVSMVETIYRNSDL